MTETNLRNIETAFAIIISIANSGRQLVGLPLNRLVGRPV
jgi:hypothetical protein